MRSSLLSLMVAGMMAGCSRPEPKVKHTHMPSFAIQIMVDRCESNGLTIVKNICEHDMVESISCHRVDEGKQ